MTFVHEEEFDINENTYKILKVQTRPGTTLTLYRQASIEDKDGFDWVSVFIIEDGDIVWNSLAENQVDEKQNISLIPCLNFLRDYAYYFEKHYPDPLIFKNSKKATRFSNKICKKHLHLTLFGPIYPS
jgi:hypothetical protein